MPRLLILSKHKAEYQRLILAYALPGLEITATDSIAEAVRLGARCDLLMGEPSLLSQVVNELTGARWVMSTWAGIEPLLRPGLRSDYTLTNARGVYGGMMAEYIFGYLLAIERRILPRWESQKAGQWDHTPHGRLKGKLLGLMGVGSIGSHLAGTAHHFGMRVHGYTRQSEGCSQVEHYFHGAARIDFARGLDYLVCVLPGTPATRRLVDASLLAALPAHAWLFNAGRGSLIDEPALVQALTAGRLGGAVLDVFEQEPLPAQHPFWKTPNTIITCHTAAVNYLPDIADLFAENYHRYQGGETLIGQVDFAAGY